MIVAVQTVNMLASSLFSTTRRFASYYVRRTRTLDYWKQSDDTVMNEFPRGRFLFMLDGQPLVKRSAHGTGFSLVFSSYNDVKKNLSDYGLKFEIGDSVLLDVSAVQSGNSHDHDSGDDWAPVFSVSLRTLPQPPEKKYEIDVLKAELASRFDEATFVDARLAILTIPWIDQRNLLAKAQALHRWTRIYRRCPKCGLPLHMKLSKSSASCKDCEQIYYPTFSPVAICLIVNERDTDCLLVRHRRSANSVFTAVAGFSEVGESMEETVRREIAEELGLDCMDIRYSGMSQPWPFPNSSMMCAFTAIADPNAKLDVAVDELECARWFSRAEVRVALERTIADPLLRKLGKNPESRQNFAYIPPQGAIAHQMIKSWVEKAH